MSGSGLSDLWRAALRLDRRRGGRKQPPPLLFFTDPARTPDPEAVLRRLPRGAGVVFRAFGAPDALAQGRRLRAIARNRGLVFLVGADARLARALRADGVHLPERLAHTAQRLRRGRPGWRITAAAHDLPALLRARRGGVDAAVISPAFPSRSPSAGKPLGPTRLAALARAAGLPAYALGGVNGRTARRLAMSGVIGVAAVEAVME
ncbi:thiamine phosphate synthase [Caulobacter sp. KR2-114]|uniref:thiamine phosphate synthase n=1 Tax=Caulobacter sp. KR2-114 TaxID=3400912 RepID=UPI003BFE9F09